MNENNFLEKDFLRFSQPVGDFYVFTAKVSEIIDSLEDIERRYDFINNSYLGGIERKKSETRINEIAHYVATEPDAMFPTPIIIAAKTSLIEGKDEEEEEEEEEEIEVEIDNGKKKIRLNLCKKYEIIDGQHRIVGIRRALEKNENEIKKNIAKIELPIIVVLNADEWDRALIFATINGKQRSVSSSFIYDLFGLQKARTPEKVSNTIIHALNQKKGGPLYRKIKILGYKTSEDEMVSQAIFSKIIIRLLKSEKEYIGRLYGNQKDDLIAIILNNVFSAVSETWKLEWGNPKYILTKSVGITAIMNSLPAITEYGKSRNSLEISLLKNVFERVKENLNTQGLDLTGENFQAQKGANKLKEFIIDAFKSEK